VQVKREQAGALSGYVGFSKSEIVDFENDLEANNAELGIVPQPLDRWFAG